MGGYSDTFYEIFAWVFIAVLALALLKTYIWYVNAIRKKHTKRIGFRTWLSPNSNGWKKWMPYAAGYLALLAFPGLVGVLWIAFLSILVFIFIIGIFGYTGYKLLNGWSIKISDKND
jgi:hypothetical protein